MKNLILFLTILAEAFGFSAHATVVAEDTAEHTINFTFGRPSADVYLCAIYLTGSNYSNLDTMEFTNGIDPINGDFHQGNYYRTFTRETAPASSILHLGSSNYGTQIEFQFCHDLQVPGGNPGGQVDTFYKIQTPVALSYFTSANLRALVSGFCPAYDSYAGNYAGWFNLGSNAATDYTFLSSIPFAADEVISTFPPEACYTRFTLKEFAIGSRPSNETPGNVTIGVKDQINFN